MWHSSGVTYFARDPLCSYFDECQKNEIYFLNEEYGKLKNMERKKNNDGILTISIKFLNVLRVTIGYFDFRKDQYAVFLDVKRPGASSI